MAKAVEVSLSLYQNEPAAKAAGRVLVNKDNLIHLTGSLEGGCLCIIEAGNGVVRREASLWLSPEPLKKSLVRMSKVFREAGGFSLAEKCRITVPSNNHGSVPVAAEIVVEEVIKRDGLAPLSAEPVQIPMWLDYIENKLDAAELIFPGMFIQDVQRRRVRRDFIVRTVDGRDNNIAQFAVDKTKVRLPTLTLPFRTAKAAQPVASAPSTPTKSRNAAFSADPESLAASPIPDTNFMPGPPKPLQLDTIDGLESTVNSLNQFLSYFDPANGYRSPGDPCAVVLQGDAGTGKTMLLKRLAATGWGGVYPIQPGEKLSTIKEIFQKAFQQRPSIITIDDIEKLLSEDRTNCAAVVKVLCDLLDQNAYPDADSDGEATQGQTPQLLVVATCSNYLRDVPADLRLPGRLDSLIAIPFPDAIARQAILRSFKMPLHPETADAMIRSLSLKTHAFNGHELRSLKIKAMRVKRDLISEQLRKKAAEIGDAYNQRQNQQSLWTQHPLTEADFDKVRQEVQPGRMDGIFVKPRPVFWHQIKGQERLVSALKMAMNMLNNPQDYEEIITPLPRGFLLYGPPGCSKTMVAQALATESGLNYFSVKGGELLNQYVGESERGIRELFERAKRASPAVIFLDEIDAVAGRRSDFGDKSASSGRGPQMVPALLSELDGFEQLSKVLVVAATNRPEALDPALLRPGRLDRHFYVPPPNESARRAILEEWTLNKKVSKNLDLDHLARLTENFSGAEVVGMCREVGLALIDVMQDGQTSVEMTTEMFEEQIKKTKPIITGVMINHYDAWKVSY